MIIRKCPKCGKFDNVFRYYPITQNKDGTYRFELILGNNCPHCGAFYKDVKKFYMMAFNKLQMSEKLDTSIDLFLDGHRDSSIREASTVLENLIRDKSGLDEHGSPLAGHAFSYNDGKKPLISLNNLTSESEINEQKGVQLMLQGFFMCIRNIAIHNSIGHSTFQTFEILCFVDFLIKVIDGKSFTQKAHWIKVPVDESIIIPKKLDRIKLNVFEYMFYLYKKAILRFI